MPMSHQLHLAILGHVDSTDEERAALTSGLREELLQNDEADHVFHPDAAVPQGAKGAAVEWAELVVTFGGTLPAIILAIQSWLRRQHPGASIMVEIDKDRISISEPTDAERAQLLEVWLRRHSRE